MILQDVLTLHIEYANLRFIRSKFLFTIVILKLYAYFVCRFEELQIIVPKAILVSRALVMANSDDAAGCFNVTHGLREFHQTEIIIYYHYSL